jgi:hypothetical protein
MLEWSARLADVVLVTLSGRHRDRGFSLLVLLVGVVIVGLVATVIVIGLLRGEDPPAAAACNADRGVLLRAEERFHTEHGRFGTEDELVAAGQLDDPLSLQDVTLVANSFKVVPTAGCAAEVPGATGPVVETHLVVSSVPDAVTAGRLINPAITVTLTDDGGAVMTDSTVEVTISLQPDNGARLLGTTTVRAVAGVATFADLAIDKAGSGYSLVAETSGATAMSSSLVTVSPGSPARLRFVASPPSATPGVVFPTQPVVDVEDDVGNVIEDATDPIVLAIIDHSGSSGGRLDCDSTSVVPTAGVATFGGCQINAAGTDFSLTATAMGLDGQSDRFAVIGPATRLVIVEQPTQAVAGDILSEITVAVEDSAGNVVTDGNATVTLTVNQNSESLTGTTSAAAVDGIATFADLTIASSATNYTLTMKADGLKTATSAVFDVATGPAAQLVFTRQPSGGKATKSWGTQPIVTVEDAFGNVVVTSVDPISLQLTPGSGDPGALLVCAENLVAAVNGEARFSKCSIDLPGNGYTLTATSDGLSGVSAPFVIT